MGEPAHPYSMPWLCPRDLEVRQATPADAPQFAARWVEGVPDFAAAFAQPDSRIQAAVRARIRRDPDCLKLSGVAVHEGRIVGVCRLVRYPGRGLNWWREARACASVLGWPAALAGMRRLRAWGWGRDVQPDELYLDAWYVVAPLRGRGIGRALMEYARMQVNLTGLNKLSAHVRNDNPDGRRILEHLGFEAAQVHRGTRGPGHPGLVLMRCAWG
ncbi:MAG: GNAT family N-acetyltransferase [Anaerolineae bacterium]|nr:GNAT family N-acetyltransferase [Anaerolineae bacterium]